MNGLTISEVAKASYVNIETIRYYERRGLISEPPRSEAGYRLFPQEVIKEIQFIKRTQDLGFTLEEIKKILAASKNEEFHSEEIYQFAVSKIKEIEANILELNKMKTLLEDLTKRCPVSGVPKCECPIIKNFEGLN